MGGHNMYQDEMGGSDWREDERQELKVKNEELKAHGERLQAAICKSAQVISYYAGGINPVMDALRMLSDAKRMTPTQSLAAHSAAIEEARIEADADMFEGQYTDSSPSIKISDYIRDSPRLYSKQGEEG